MPQDFKPRQYSLQGNLTHLRGLDDLTPEDQLAMFRSTVEPTKPDMQMSFGNDETGKPILGNVPTPQTPYPFNNPVTMTKDLDNSVKRLRQIAPGLGTAQPATLTSNPNIARISTLVGRPELRDSIAKGEFSTDDLNLLGLTNPTQKGASNVYINPRVKGDNALDTVVAHEMSHRNIPSTNDDYGSIKYPGALTVENLLNKLKGLGFNPGDNLLPPKKDPIVDLNEQIKQELVKRGADPNSIKIVPDGYISDPEKQKQFDKDMEEMNKRFSDPIYNADPTKRKKK